MRPATPKRAAQNRLYAKLRREFLASRPRCEHPNNCQSAATEVHHRKGRVGALLLDETHWSALCHDCHVHVTEHPREAIALGISESRLSYGTK
jgi:hypothetical protein